MTQCKPASFASDNVIMPIQIKPSDRSYHKANGDAKLMNLVVAGRNMAAEKAWR